MKRIRFNALRWHHKLMLWLSPILLGWFISGVYFVWLELGYIRGDHYRINQPQFLSAEQNLLPVSQILAAFPDARQVALSYLADTPYYRVDTAVRPYLVNALTGQTVDRLSARLARQIAQSYLPQVAIKHLVSTETAPPSELSPRHLPSWTVTFDDTVSTTLYLSMHNGEVVARRHHFWRLFDALWRVHILDLDDGMDIQTPWLTLAILLALMGTLLGVVAAWPRWRRGRL